MYRLWNWGFSYTAPSDLVYKLLLLYSLCGAVYGPWPCSIASTVGTMDLPLGLNCMTMAMFYSLNCGDHGPSLWPQVYGLWTFPMTSTV